MTAQDREAAFVREHYLFEVLVSMYHTYPRAVAAMCDEHLDPSGRLLGWVREENLLRG